MTVSDPIPRVPRLPSLLHHLDVKGDGRGGRVASHRGVSPASRSVARVFRRRSRSLRKLVVIGNGMASYKLCERLVAAESPYQITVLGEEPYPAYDRVRLTRLLQGDTVAELALAPGDWYTQNKIDLVLGDPVVTVDRPHQLVRTSSGRELTYDTLVFATGSRAFVPSLPGAGLPGVCVYRNVRDLESIRDYAYFARRAAVLGGGLLGLEVAHALAGLGLQTWIVERGTGLLTRQLDPEAARLLQTHVERLGLKVCPSRETEAIEALGTDRLLQFKTGECLRVQLVVFAAGIRPRDELARASGLKIAPRGGIEVDDQLRTSDSRVYALGECASHRGTVHGLAPAAYSMADALSGVLLGGKRSFAGTNIAACLKLPGIFVATLGDYQADGEVLVNRTGGSYRRVVLERGRLVGATVVGEWPELPRLQQAIDQRHRFWPWRRERFLREGKVFRRALLPVSAWPPEAIVCNCLTVRRRTLSAACAVNGATVDSVARCTGASTVCGSCRPLLMELIGGPAISTTRPGTGGLLAGSLAALALASAVLFFAPVPFSSSTQDFSWDFLWRSSDARQWSGWVMLALMGLGLVFSLRKRWSRLRLGSVALWRSLHVLLGAATVVALVTHTGLRLGENFNRILLLNFVSLALLGGLAGAVTALEKHWPGPAARRLRAVWTMLHIVLVWPLPVLLFFHVLASYRF